MKDQINTVRQAINRTLALLHSNGYRMEHLKEALTALDQLEAMVVEPYGTVTVVRKPGCADMHWFYRWPDPPYLDNAAECHTVYTAAPVAQQYEAGDMASAAAQGFRDGVASVAQQPPKLEDIEQYRMQMAGISTAAIGYWKEGDPIHPDYDTPALRDVAKLYAKYDALYKAQQPQARPDFTDEWAGYLKDGETPFERFLRERKDLQSVLKLYQRVLEENERLKGQQPQAEAVQQKPKLIGWRTSDYLMETSDKDKADNWAVHNEILPIFEGDPYTKLVAAPQQAEAAPPDVVRDAAPIPDHELVTMYDERPTSDLEMIEFAREVERRHGIGVQPQHITDGSPCWCNPDVAYTDPETGASVIVHRRPQ